jgi:hypothetical protein
MTTSQPSPVQPVTPETRPEPPKAEGCCGGPAPADTSACCALDAEVKSTGGTGCGCATEPKVTRKSCC